ncbi:MAG: FG-GAP-like repeat-containing protein [Gammaproteobacteria bacterium]
MKRPIFDQIMSCSRSLLIAISAIGLFACGGDGAPADDQPVALALNAADIALNNRGVALMGYFDYPGAREVFAQAVERQPQWSDAKINLAIATLNRQTEGDEERALALATDVLASDPSHLRAHYVSGLLKLYRGVMDEAAVHFQTVLDGDPGDAYAAYYLGQCVAERDTDRALELYELARTIDPYLRSAYYRSAQLQRRVATPEQAKENFDAYARLADNPRARLAEFKYTRMGERGNALAVDLPGAEKTAAPTGALFEAPVALARLSRLYGDASLTVADVQGDGILDLYVASGTQDVPSALFLGAEDELQRASDHPLAQVVGVRAAAWGDLNNDGMVDVYLCRDGANQLWQQGARNQWRNVTSKSGTDNGRLRCADVALVDADHDGDLDIFIANEDGPTELLSNNQDGTFRSLGGERGLDFGDASARQLLVTDLDNDRDVDLVVIGAQPPHQVFWNDRLWAYRLDTTNPAFAAADIHAAVTVDADADGHTDVVSVSSDGALSLWQRDPVGSLAQRALGERSYGGGVTLAAVEMDGDAIEELLVLDDTGVTVVDLTSGAADFTSTGDVGAAVAVVEEPRAGPGLWVTQRDVDGVQLRRHAPGTGRGQFAAFTFSGKEEQAESMRSNRSGIGTRVALRTGSRWTLTETFDRHSGPGQSLQPLALGLGSADRADYVALTWSDGVYQTELDLAAGEIHPLTETQRQLSSCPVVFAWNGEAFDFVSDVLGVGGIGFLIEPGRYAEPRPWEYFLLPDGALAPTDDNTLALKITEPMAEIAYLDQARLHVYDLAPGWSMVLDERMATGAPAVTGDPLFYQQRLLPIRALDGAGGDITDRVVARDGLAASPGPLDARFIGRTRAPHTLELEFNQSLDGTDKRPVLVADGWVEYPYSQTVFAAWQAGAGYVPPTLEARDAKGQWHTVYPNFGYPAGMPRRMALPLDDLPDDTVALRLTSSLQIYWDHAFVALTEAPGKALTMSAAPLREARVARTGFARRIAHPQRRPGYDYADRQPLWDSRFLTGYYTEFGDATELVEPLDNAFAIIGPGEEVHVEFEAPEPVPSSQRHYVLEVRGFAKDMDLYTHTGGTVAPLPGEQDAQRDALHERYNTRFEAGR